MEIAIYFHDGGSFMCDDVGHMEVPKFDVREVQLIFFNGITVRFNDGEKVTAHRIRTHAKADGQVIERYYVVLTTERKLFFFQNGTFVTMPEHGERDAWWRTFAKMPIGAMEEVVDVKPTESMPLFKGRDDV